jgi:hypothetical protein
VSPALVAIAIAVLAGGVLALSARDARAAILGTGVALIAAPLLADPLPTPLALAARLVAAILATYLLWVAVRHGRAATGGSRLGWPAEALMAVAAAVVGYGTHGLGASASGPPEAQAAGFALAALAVVPVVTGRDIIRIGLGLLMLTVGAVLVRVALGGTPSDFEQLAIAGLLTALGGSVAILAAAARFDGPEGFDLIDDRRRYLSRTPNVRSVRIPHDLPPQGPRDAVSR